MTNSRATIIIKKRNSRIKLECGSKYSSVSYYIMYSRATIIIIVAIDIYSGQLVIELNNIYKVDSIEGDQIIRYSTNLFDSLSLNEIPLPYKS